MGAFDSYIKGAGNSAKSTGGSAFSSFAKSQLGTDLSGFDRERKRDTRLRRKQSKQESVINQRLDQGRSWEDISKETGIGLDKVRQFSQATRPEYGIKAPPPQPSIIQKAGGFAKEVVKDVVSPVNYLRKAAAENIGDITGTNRSLQAEQNVRVSDLAKTIIDARKRLKDPKLSSQQKKQFKLVEQGALKSMQEIAGSQKSRAEETLTNVDRTRGVGSALEAGSMLVGGTGIKAAYKAGGKRAVATALAKTGASGAVGGAGFELRSNADVDVGRIARGAAIGAGLGVGFSGAAAAVGAGGRKAATTTKQATSALNNSKLGQLVKESKPVQKVVAVKDEFTRGLIRDTNYIEKQFGGAVDKEGWKVKDKIRNLTTNIRQSTGYADSKLDSNEGWQELAATIGNKKAKQEYGSFIKQKQDAINHNKLVESGRAKGVLKEVPTGTAEQEAAYQSLNKATKPIIQEMFDEGYINKAKYDRWMGDTDYTRVQREVEEDLINNFSGAGLSPKAKRIAEQQLKGSDKNAVDPFASLVDWNRRVTTELEKNKLTKYVRDQMLEKGITKPVRVAGKVIERMELYGEAAQLRPVRNKLARVIKSQEKYVKQIKSELDKLNSQGLDESLRKPTTSTGKGLVDDLLATDTAQLQAIRDKIGTRDKRLTNAIDEITAIKNDYDAAKTEVNDLVTRARSLADAETSEDTMTVFENGIRELYTVEPKAAKQLSGITDATLGGVAKAALISSKLLRTGATAWNAAFTVPNFVMDQVNSAVMSKNVFATHNPIVFLESLKETALKPVLRGTVGKVPGVKNAVTGLLEPSDTYKAFIARNKHMTRVDLTRRLKAATREASDLLGTGENKIRRAGRAVEDIIAAPEVTTRYQNYLGTLKKAMKDKNLSPQDAMALADEAARNNSINFSNRGELSTFMKIFNPYLNAGVQASVTLGRAIKERPVSTGIKIAATTLAPVAAATYYNLSDPKRARIYANLSEAERKGNIVMVTDSGAVVKIPIPPSLRPFAQPLRNQIESEYLGDKQSMLETAKNIFLDPFSPVGTTKNELLANALPQPIKPIAEVAMNRDLYFGTEVVPENLKGLPKEEQVYDSTPAIYKGLAKKLNMSPLQVRKLVTGYTAGGGEGALATVDQVRGKESGGRATSEQVVKRFYRAPGDEGTAVKSKFYDAYNPINSKKQAISKKITAAVRANDIDKASKLARDLNDEVEKEKKRLKEGYGRFETDLSVLYDQFDGLKFPVSGGRLSEGSIAYRKKL